MWRRLAISGETGEMGQSREACKVRVTDRVRNCLPPLDSQEVRGINKGEFSGH